MLLIFAAMVVFAGYTVLSRSSDELRTVTAVGMELRESVESQGWCVREETVVVSPQGGASLQVGEGEKVAAGATLAIAYNSASDLSRAEEIRSLTLELSELRARAAGKSSPTTAQESVAALCDAISRHDFSELDAITLSLSNGLAAEEELSMDTLAARVEELENRISNLRITAGGNAAVRSPKAGTFSAGVDGFERVGPADVSGRLLPSAVEALFSKPDAVPAGAFGKVVTGYRWYYVTILPYAEASRLMGRSTVSVTFSRSYAASLTMRVVSVGTEENGRAAVVLSSDRAIFQVAGVREMTAEIVFSVKSGIRVPREAVHLGEFQVRLDPDIPLAPGEEPRYTTETRTVVYVLRGYQARRVEVEILGEEGDWYMVSADPTLLREGAEIITHAASLTDGAVVKE